MFQWRSVWYLKRNCANWKMWGWRCYHFHLWPSSTTFLHPKGKTIPGFEKFSNYLFFKKLNKNFQNSGTKHLVDNAVNAQVPYFPFTNFYNSQEENKVQIVWKMTPVIRMTIGLTIFFWVKFKCAFMGCIKVFEFPDFSLLWLIIYEPFLSG